MAGMLRVPRSRGALTGALLVLLGIWGGLIAFVGPYFHYAYTPDKAWTYTTGRLWLEILPGAAVVLGGLIVGGSASRPVAIFGAWLAALSGAWFVLGGLLSTLWTIGGNAGHPVGNNLHRVTEQIGFFTGLGVVIVFLAAVALGRFTVIGHRERLAAEALENYAIFVRRAKEVAAAVSEHFALAEADVIRVHEVAAPVELIKDFDVDSNFLEKKAKGAGLATFQKAYSGMLMFTMLTHLAGLTLFPMFLPVIGLAPAMLMGRAGLMDDRRRKLEQRRAEAKVTVRRFVDDFNLQVGKDSRDAVRHVQRELRSACADRVTELQRSASEALAAAQTSVASTESASKQRERIDSDLATLASLRARMDDLAAHRRRTEIPPSPAQGVQS